jgi:hypothetical protein
MSAANIQPALGLEVVLSRLDGVQRSGAGYRARCPACGGRTRKLSIKDADDGRVLIHCFGGCGVAEVLGSMGLQLTDLFPSRQPPATPEQRRAWRRACRESQWGAALEVLDFEATVVHVAGRQTLAGEVLGVDDLDRLSVACDRISEAREVLRGR